jgi:hypothetical protein
MLEIIIYNIIFWTVWIFICSLPAMMFKYALENHGDMSKHRKHTTKYEDLCQ